MSSNKNQRMQDLEIFARALENVLRKLIRFLVGRISLLKLSEMIRTIYIQEAERQLKLEQPAKSVSLTKLAVLTGIDTRTLTKVRNSGEYLGPVHKTKRFLKEMTPENCILDMWTSDSKFLASKTGQPKLLKMSEGQNSFEQLVGEAVSSRGVTAQSLLEKLISNGSVRFHKDSNEVELLRNIVIPKRSGDAIESLEVGFVHTSILLDTVFHNYNATIQGTEKFFQRGSWTNRLNPKNRAKFEKTLHAFLEQVDQQARKMILPFEENYQSDDQITAGVGFHYFEDISGPESR